ncbi:hypothetical protein HK104_010534 [Borealophlyctis nickersoniae]|nr:hypothetical protein HK104_010534 [Borealophlyctis nickersoniae]
MAQQQPSSPSPLLPFHAPLKPSPVTTPRSHDTLAPVLAFTPARLADVVSRRHPSASAPSPSSPSSAKPTTTTTTKSASNTLVPSLLVLDVRPYTSFVKARVAGSINICVPSTLLKRPSWGMDRLLDGVPSERTKRLLKAVQDPKAGKAVCLVVIDDDPTDRATAIAMAAMTGQDGTAAMTDNPMGTPPPESRAALLLKKLQKEGCHATVGWLRGGLDAFAAQYPNLIDSGTPSNGALPIAGKGGLILPAAGIDFAKIPLSTPNTTTTATFTNVNNNKRTYFDCFAGPVTAPVGLFTTSSGPPATSSSSSATPSPAATIDLPDTFALLRSDIMLPPHAPPVLRNLLGAKDVRADLARKFALLESASKRRQRASMHATSADDEFCVSVGLEAIGKNRYNNIWPYNRNRVKLDRTPHSTSPDTDYINASHVDVVVPHNTVRRYIATQGPIPSTFADFYRMVWEQRARIIVMVTKEEERSRTQCHRYWPSNVGERMDLGDIVVENCGEVYVPEVPATLRTLGVEVGGEVRKVVQVQYLGWPDYGVPSDPESLLHLHELVERVRVRVAGGVERVKFMGPVVVHCSAGCGRTGTFIAVNAALARIFPGRRGDGFMWESSSEMSMSLSGPATSSSSTTSTTSLHPPTSPYPPRPHHPTTPTSSAPPTTPPSPTDGDVDGNDPIYNLVASLRDQRILMVQSLSQFAIIYEVVLRRARWGGTPGVGAGGVLSGIERAVGGVGV